MVKEFKVEFTVRQGKRILETTKPEDKEKMKAQKLLEQQQQAVASNQNLTGSPEYNKGQILYRTSPDCPVQFAIRRVPRDPQSENVPKYNVYSRDKQQPVVSQPAPQHTFTPAQSDQVWVQYSSKANGKTPVNKELLPILSTFLDTVYTTYGRHDAIDLAKRLGLYYTDPNNRKPTVVQNNKETVTGTVQKEKPIPVASMNAPTTITIKTDEGVKQDKISSETSKPTTGLYPVEAKTAEEIEKEDLESRQENVAMGFPGIPLVDTMRFRDQLPQIKETIRSRFSNFTPEGNENQVTTYLQNEVTKLVGKQIADLMKTDEKGLAVGIINGVDNLNKTYYDIVISNYHDPICSVRIYPVLDETQSTNLKSQERQIAPGINPLSSDQQEEEIQHFKTVSVGDFLWDRVQVHKNEVFETVQSDDDRKAYFYGLLLDDLKKYAAVEEDLANYLASQYVQMHYPFDHKPVKTTNDDDDTKKDEVDVATEL